MEIVMSSLKALLFAVAFSLASSVAVLSAADEGGDKGEKIAVTDLPATVKSGFAKEVPGGELTSAKKLGGDKPRYQIKYKFEGKEHQITLAEDGTRTRKKKEDGSDGDEK
jgi:hypothetical protein